MGRGAIGMGRGWQWGGGQHEEEMERGAMGRGQGAMGKGRWGEGNRTGEKGMGQRGGEEEGARGEGISQMDMMKCLGGMRLQSFLTLFTRAAPGTPASTYIKLEKGMSTNAKCPVEWREISMKQSVGKCKQINF